MTSSFSDLSRIQQNASLWDGNVTQYDWIGEEQPDRLVWHCLADEDAVNTGSVVQADEGVKLILTESNSECSFSAITKLTSLRWDEDFLDEIHPLREDRLYAW